MSIIKFKSYKFLKNLIKETGRDILKNVLSKLFYLAVLYLFPQYIDIFTKIF